METRPDPGAPGYGFRASDYVKEMNNSSYMDDEGVWNQFKNGNQSSLTFIYRKTVKSLFNYGCQFTGNKELVKDTIQDLFIELINSRARLGKTNSIKFYLFKALRNKLCRILTKKTEETRPGFEDDIPFLVSVSHEHTLINQQLTEKKKQLIAQKLNELPALQREALLLFYYEGMKYDQIADILGIKVKSARALAYRGIDSLGKLLASVKDQMVQ